MTSKNPFFTDFKITGILIAVGFLFIFIGSFWARQIQLEWMAVLIAGCCLITALYFNMRTKGKENEQVKRM